jgi:hypothetical protein
MTTLATDFGVIVADAVVEVAPDGSGLDDDCVSVAVLTIDAEAEVTVTVMVSVADALSASVPTFQVTVLPDALAVVPALAAEETYVRPSGSGSVTSTDWAGSGPPFRTVSV